VVNVQWRRRADGEGHLENDQSVLPGSAMDDDKRVQEPVLPAGDESHSYSVQPTVGKRIGDTT
jgi:hypothetical protein